VGATHGPATVVGARRLAAGWSARQSVAPAPDYADPMVAREEKLRKESPEEVGGGAGDEQEPTTTPWQGRDGLGLGEPI
jgi:hypothetical protein